MITRSIYRKISIRKKRGERGFTLVEVMIAMVILSTGILALTLMMKQSVSSTDYGRKVTAAENLALQKLEELKIIGYYNIPAAAVTEDYGAINGYPEFRREATTQILQGIGPGAPQGFLRQVTVTVRWRSAGSIGQGGKVELSTFVTP